MCILHFCKAKFKWIWVNVYHSKEKSDFHWFSMLKCFLSCNKISVFDHYELWHFLSKQTKNEYNNGFAGNTKETSLVNLKIYFFEKYI